MGGDRGSEMPGCGAYRGMAVASQVLPVGRGNRRCLPPEQTPQARGGGWFGGDGAERVAPDAVTGAGEEEDVGFDPGIDAAGGFG